jgi:Molybdopterin-binding domain of aldehyde dehydrogenase
VVTVTVVDVDRETGEVKAIKVVTAHDVGTVINPLAHQGQIDGGRHRECCRRRRRLSAVRAADDSRASLRGPAPGLEADPAQDDATSGCTALPEVLTRVLPLTLHAVVASADAGPGPSPGTPGRRWGTTPAQS